ncbi:MAG: MBL fold metallo-hydrolase [bacterium]|nr:MBL fold metallo-hydrolase [bacterium]
MDILKGVIHLNHASLKFERDKTIYIDPFRLTTGETHDADIIFLTHDHMDHFSPEDIKKVMKEDTVMVVPEKNAKKIRKKYRVKEVIGVLPFMEEEVEGIPYKTVPAYNLEKKYHKKKKNWMGFIITLDGTDYYIAGDTDFIPEMEDIKADVIFLPVGGTYTCDAEEAAKAANALKPKVAVPIHFGSIVGTKEDAEAFVRKLDDGIEGIILLNSD